MTANERMRTGAPVAGHVIIRSDFLRFIGLALLILALLALAGTAAAQGSQAVLTEPLTIEAVSAFAREHRAEIQAAHERSRAGRAAAGASGKPPDPMIMANLDHLPLPEIMGADVSFMVQQAIPLSGELGARVRRAEWNARALEEDERTAVLDVEVEAANAFLMLAEEQAMLELVRQQIAVVASLQEIVQVQLSTGRGSPADLLRTGLERARLEVERDSLTATLKVSDAMLDAALGRRPDPAIPTCTLPEAGVEPPRGAELVTVALARRSELASMRRRVSAAEEDVEVMRNMRLPMGVFGLGAAYTMSDGFGLMATVGVSVPIWAGEYDSAIDQAKAMASMERSQVRAMATMIEGSVIAARERVEAARVREESVRVQLLPQGEQVLKSLLASYAGGDGSVVAVVEGFQTVQMIEMQHIGVRTELARARAALRRQLGVSVKPARSPVGRE